MSTLASVIIRDTYANRPAAGVAGRIFFASDTLNQYRDNGSTWDDITPSAGASKTVVTTSGSQTSVSFTSISGSFTNIRIVYSARHQTATTTSIMYIQFNSDATSGNYEKSQYVLGTGTGGYAQNSDVPSASAGAYVTDLVGSSAPSGHPTVGEIIIPAYAGTTLYKSGRAISKTAYGSSAGQPNSILDSAFTWKSTSAITRIDFTVASSAAFVNNSVFTMYLE